MKNNINLFFVFLFLFGFAFSQDKQKCQRELLLASNAIKNSDVTSSLTSSKNALSEAFLLKDHELKAKAYYFIGFSFNKLADKKNATYFFEKGLNESIFTNNDSIKAYLHTNLSIIYEKNNARKAADYYKKALFYFKKSNFSNENALAIFQETKLQASEKWQQKTSLNVSNYVRQIEIIEQEKKQSTDAFQDSKTVDLLLIIIIGILLLLVFSLLRNNKQRERSNKVLEKSNADLLISKEKAEKATQLKSQFVSSITHELRTPLYGVVGITDIIIDEHKELANSPHINSLRFSATYLLSLVNDLLQINKIEERKITLDKNILNLSEELTIITNSLQFIALKNANKVIIAIDQAIPSQLIGDKLRLSQVFINLISNALKFTKKGQVTISANLEKSTDEQHFIKFEVKDTGIGIAKEAQEEIFEKFVQIERNEDDYQGTGLGLAIVKNLVAIFGGKIELESQEGKGTRFYFTIPFNSVQAEKTTIVSKALTSRSNNVMHHVLVVEDNKINQIVTRKILEKNNFDCTVIDNGYAAIEILENKPVDIILMDINMPIINGYDTTKLIRSKGFVVPIVALTAFDKEEVADKVYSAGMDNIIIKPFDKDKLFEIITEMICKK